MTRNYFLTGALLIVAVLIATAVSYPHLPNMVPTHWDIHEQTDGYSPKWTLFVIQPGIMIALMLIFAGLPWLSPKRFEVDSFRSTYLYIMVVILAMLVYIHALILWAGFSLKFSVGRAATGGVCLLIALLGNVLGKVRRNLYVGLRTPWAIASERVWNATHRFAAKTFFVAGLTGLVSVALRAPFWFPMTAIGAGVLAPVIYSLVFYKRLERQGEL